MEEVEKKGLAEAAADDEEVTLLDIDLLCSAVAKQANKGNWIKLNGEAEEDNHHQQGGGVFRMWEGELVSDCFDDRRIAFQSICCPCFRFGKNMKRAGFGSCFLQGSILLILSIIAISCLVAFMITRWHCFLYLAISFSVSMGAYLGYYRMQIRKKFNIKGHNSFDDCVYHFICPCCTLCQESRTLEMNNVQDGIWHGRGDTICIGGSLSDDSIRPFVVSTKVPEFVTMQKTSDNTILISTSETGHSSPLVPKPE